MVRLLEKKQILTDKSYCEYAGLSTDNKPETSGLVTGSSFLEVDTGKIYLYNEEGAAGSKWVDQDFEDGEEA